DLVVDPAPARVPGPRVGILSGDQHIGRTGDVLEILHAPRIGFADGHSPALMVRSVARRRVANHGPDLGPSFEMRPSGAPQDEDGVCVAQARYSLSACTEK